jgi:hypothetical protein
MTDNKSLMRNIKQKQPAWFSPENRRFFNDVSYWAYYGKRTGERYMVRSTYAWTDMFGSPPRLHYRVNRIGEDFDIRPLVDREFHDLDEVEEWLEEN